VIGGQGREVAGHIAERLNRSVVSLPVAIDWSDYNHKELNHSPLQIGFLGMMRAEKGFRQFVEALDKLTADVHIVVQVQSPRAHGESNVSKLIAKLKRNHNCQIIEGELTIREYRRILSNIDITILPYRPDAFAIRTSNLFSESIGLGKLIVAPKATLMGKMLDRMNIGISYSPYTSKALREAITVAVSNYSKLNKYARKKADDWRRQNSADAFIKTLINKR
jgi:glycosyltransferase involved in cell wall biosynthesis